MARIVLTTHGSRGDLNPFIALAEGLVARGHTIQFAVAPPLLAPLAVAGYTALPLTDIEEDALAADLDRIFKPSHRGALPARELFLRGTLPTLAAKVDELRAACANADLLVTGANQHAGPIVADLTGIPWATLVFSPLYVPSRFTTPIKLPIRPHPLLQPIANLISWEIGSFFIRRAADQEINAVRAQYGLPPRRTILLDGALSHQLTAVTVSPAFLLPPPDWPPYVQMTGFCFWDVPPDWQEPPALTAFLAESDPVVALSSGSMAPWIASAFREFYQTGMAAILQAGARALIIGAAPGVLPDPLPPNVYAVPFAPLSEVYPRCAATIHHGGMGTTAQALRAGIPMIVAPWGADQFFTGEQITQLGVGQTVSRTKLTVQQLAQALTNVLRQLHYHTKVADAAQQIAHEDGVVQLCTAIENVLRKS